MNTLVLPSGEFQPDALRIMFTLGEHTRSTQETHGAEESLLPDPGTTAMSTPRLPRSPVRVLWVVDSLAFHAGTEQQLLALGKHLDRSRCTLEVAVLDGPQPSFVTDVFPRIATFPVEHIWSFLGFWQVLRLARYMRSGRFDVVHAFMVKSGVAAVAASAMVGSPVVLTSRRDLGYYYTSRWLKTVRLLNRRVTRITVNSESAREITAQAEGYSRERIDVMYNGVDLNRFYPAWQSEQDVAEDGAYSLPPGSPVVGIVANYREVKDLPLFLRAAARVLAELPEVTFVLVGQGHLQPALESLAAELGIAHRVIFTAGSGSVPSWLRRMRIACLSSVSEGFSNAILEYMATGIPVVAMDVGGIREAVEHGKTGLLVSDRTPEAFADCILRLLKNPELADQMGKAGLDRCRVRFSMEAATRNLEEYYLSLTRRKIGVF